MKACAVTARERRAQRDHGRPPARPGAVGAALALTVVWAWTAPAFAKTPEPPETTSHRGGEMTFIDHDRTGPFWIGAQANSIFQYNPPFRSPYSGTNSLHGDGEAAISGVITLFGAYRAFPLTELIVDPEIALGGGLSGAVGAAGFPNLDVVRNPSLSHNPYIARAEIHQIIPLSREWVENEDRGPINSMPLVPKHRIELRFGKMSTADVFDVNPAGSDSHLQFMNWTVDNNGAWDYAADTRGYTYGLVVEYQGPDLELRWGTMLMPTVANGLDLDTDISRARGDNLELEIKYSRRPAWAGTARLLGYINHANMGNYDEAIAAGAAAGTTPNITAVRRQGRLKRGFGINLFQEAGPLVRLFARFGWNDGQNESFAYTEVDNTVEIGGDLLGVKWHRPTDRTGLAFVTNGISGPHAEYLRRGGLGFILGDGDLSYARETIVEHYYNVHIWGGAFVAEDIQVIVNPGYNSARGPAWVFSLRAHLEL
jgi:high affinity Mn2+ porin